MCSSRMDFPEFHRKTQSHCGRDTRVIQRQGESREARHSATKAMLTGRAQALDALSRLDSIVENLLRDNPPERSAWKSARHVARTARSTKAPDPAIVKSPLVPPVPVTEPAAALL